MRLSVGRIVTAGAVAGLVGLGVVSYAYAQTSDPTTTTPPASSPSGNGDGPSTHDCPNMGGSNGSSSSSSSASQTAYHQLRFMRP